MLTGCYMVWNEADVISESIRSLKPYVDRFVFIDSVFKANDVDATHSTDRTREVCERLAAPIPVTYIESDRKLGEHEARNAYLDQVPPGEWIINLDGDEVLYGDHFEILATLGWVQGSDYPPALNIPVLSAAVTMDGYAVTMDRSHYESGGIIHTRGHAPRLFRNTPTLRYREMIFDGVVDPRGAYEGNRTLGSLALRDDRLMVINHHVRQSFEGYQHDAVWETINELPVG